MERAKGYEKHKAMHGHNAVAYNTFCNRLYAGRSLEKAINQPTRGHGGKREYPTLKEIYKGAKGGRSYSWFVKCLNKYLYD